ncbi:MAG: hypothetical protein AAF957_25670 [Planctomycetota bacterium]
MLALRSKRLLRAAVPSCLAASLCSTTYAQFEDHGAPPGESATFTAISADGSTLIGRTFMGQTNVGPVCWTRELGFVDLTSSTGALPEIIDVSDDGQRILGDVFLTEALMWDPSGARIDLGVLGPTSLSWPRVISGDGMTVAGGVSGGSLPVAGFIWTAAGGLVDLGNLGGDQVSVRDINRDGSVVVGLATDATGRKRAFRWTPATGMVDLGGLTSGDHWADSVSADGEEIAGGFVDANGTLSTFWWSRQAGFVSHAPFQPNSTGLPTLSADGSTVIGNEAVLSSSRAFRWSQADGYQWIDVPGWQDSIATGVSADGSVVSGVLRSGPLFSAGFRWTAATGAVVLPDFGIPGTFANAVSADGTIAGATSHPGGTVRAVRWTASGEIGGRVCSPGVPNSTVSSGRLTLEGSNSIELGAMTLAASSLPPGAFGYFLASRAPDRVTTIPGSVGVLCLGGPIGRFVGPGQIVQADTSGRLSITIDPATLPSPTGPVLPSFGETWYFQAWHRDAQPASTSNFTDSVTIRIY